MLVKPDSPSLQVVTVYAETLNLCHTQDYNQWAFGPLGRFQKCLEDSRIESVFLWNKYVVKVALGWCVEGAYKSAKDIFGFTN
jgi:hypothetical protein